MFSFTDAVAVAREKAAATGSLQWLKRAKTNKPAPWDYEWSVVGGWDCEGVIPGYVVPDAVLACADDEYYVYPSGLCLSIADIPWVWAVHVTSPERIDYVLGTAREAERYRRGIKRLVYADQFYSVPDYRLNGLLVSVVTPVCFQDEGGVVHELNESVECVLARPLPSWTRHWDQAPRHEEWPGIAPNQKVWPMVPSGFTEDFAFVG